MSPISLSGRGASFEAPPRSINGMRSYSEPPKDSPASPTSLAEMKSKIPLEESTIDHLRQAIRSQAEGIAHSFKISGPKTFWFRKRITKPALQRAAALITIHLSEVLDLELTEESAYHREPTSRPHYQESDWQYAPLSDNENYANNGAQHIEEDVRDETFEAQESRSKDVSNDISDSDQSSEDELGSNIEDRTAPQSQIYDEEESQDDLKKVGAASNQAPFASPPPSQETLNTPARKTGLFSRLVPSALSNLFMPTPPSSPAPPPQSATPSISSPAAPAVQPVDLGNRQSSKTPEPSPSLSPVAAIISASSPTRHRSTQTPEVVPSPTSPPALGRRTRQSPRPSTPLTPTPAAGPATMRAKIPELPPAFRPANAPSRKTPEPAPSSSSSSSSSPSPIIPPRNPSIQPHLPSSSSSSDDDDDELLTPLPPTISPRPSPHPTTRKPRTPSTPTRRSPRTNSQTTKSRRTPRLAQMIPPNLRTAGSWGPYKTLPGPRMPGGGGERGRSIGRSTGQKRSGSASSVSSVGSRERSGYGGGGVGGGGKRTRFGGVQIVRAR